MTTYLSYRISIRPGGIKRVFSLSLTGAFLFTNVLAPYAAEKNFWAERQKTVQKMKQESELLGTLTSINVGNGLKPFPTKQPVSHLNKEQSQLLAQLPQATKLNVTTNNGTPLFTLTPTLSHREREAKEPPLLSGNRAFRSSPLPMGEGQGEGKRNGLNEHKERRYSDSWLSAILPYGSIGDIYISKSPNSPLVIHIQDVHSVLEAQKNIANIIQSVVAQFTGGEALSSFRIERRPDGTTTTPNKLGNYEQRHDTSVLIGVEGASGGFNIHPYRNFPDAAVTRDIAEYFLKEGYIGGPEFAGLTAPEIPSLWGVEDLPLYEKNIQTIYDSQKNKPQLQTILNEFKKSAANFKEKIYSKELKEFDQHFNAYRNEEGKLGAYVRYLVRVGANANVVAQFTGGETLSSFRIERRLKMPDKSGNYERNDTTNAIKKFPNLLLLLQALNLEETLDFKVVEQERLQLIETLVKKLTQEQLTELVQESINYKLGHLNYGEYHQYLKQLCKNNSIPIQNFTKLNSYINYVGLAERINRNKLLDELTNLEEQVQNSLAVTPEQKRLVAANKSLIMLQKLADHEMTTDDWNYYEKNREAILQNLSPLPLGERDIQVTTTTPDKSGNYEQPNELNELLTPFEDFCRYATQRNNAFINNLLSELRVQSSEKEKQRTESVIASTAKQSQVYRDSGIATSPSATRNDAMDPMNAVAVLVAGGFHTQGLTQTLRQKDVSYVVVTPKITEVPKDNHYLDVFARKPLPLEKLFSGEKIFIVEPLGLASKPVNGKKAFGLGRDMMGAQILGQIDVQVQNGQKNKNPPVDKKPFENNAASLGLSTNVGKITGEPGVYTGVELVLSGKEILGVATNPSKKVVAENFLKEEKYFEPPYATILTENRLYVFGTNPLVGAPLMTRTVNRFFSFLPKRVRELVAAPIVESLPTVIIALSRPYHVKFSNYLLEQFLNAHEPGPNKLPQHMKGMRWIIKATQIGFVAGLWLGLVTALLALTPGIILPNFVGNLNDIYSIIIFTLKVTGASTFISNASAHFYYNLRHKEAPLTAGPKEQGQNPQDQDDQDLDAPVKQLRLFLANNPFKSRMAEIIHAYYYDRDFNNVVTMPASSPTTEMFYKFVREFNKAQFNELFKKVSPSIESNLPTTSHNLITAFHSLFGEVDLIIQSSRFTRFLREAKAIREEIDSLYFRLMPSERTVFREQVARAREELNDFNADSGTREQMVQRIDELTGWLKQLQQTHQSILVAVKSSMQDRLNLVSLITDDWEPITATDVVKKWRQRYLEIAQRLETAANAEVFKEISTDIINLIADLKDLSLPNVINDLSTLSRTINEEKKRQHISQELDQMTTKLSQVNITKAGDEKPVKEIYLGLKRLNNEIQRTIANELTRHLKAVEKLLDGLEPGEKDTLDIDVDRFHPKIIHINFMSVQDIEQLANEIYAINIQTVEEQVRILQMKRPLAASLESLQRKLDELPPSEGKDNLQKRRNSFVSALNSATSERDIVLVELNLNQLYFESQTTIIEDLKERAVFLRLDILLLASPEIEKDRDGLDTKVGKFIERLQNSIISIIVLHGARLRGIVPDDTQLQKFQQELRGFEQELQRLKTLERINYDLQYAENRQILLRLHKAIALLPLDHNRRAEFENRLEDIEGQIVTAEPDKLSIMLTDLKRLADDVQLAIPKTKPEEGTTQALTLQFTYEFWKVVFKALLKVTTLGLISNDKANKLVNSRAAELIIEILFAWWFPLEIVLSLHPKKFLNAHPQRTAKQWAGARSVFIATVTAGLAGAIFLALPHLFLASNITLELAKNIVLKDILLPAVIANMATHALYNLAAAIFDWAPLTMHEDPSRQKITFRKVAKAQTPSKELIQNISIEPDPNINFSRFYADAQYGRHVFQFLSAWPNLSLKSLGYMISTFGITKHTYPIEDAQSQPLGKRIFRIYPRVTNDITLSNDIMAQLPNHIREKIITGQKINVGYSSGDVPSLAILFDERKKIVERIAVQIYDAEFDGQFIEITPDMDGYDALKGALENQLNNAGQIKTIVRDGLHFTWPLIENDTDARAFENKVINDSYQRHAITEIGKRLSTTSSLVLDRGFWITHDTTRSGQSTGGSVRSQSDGNNFYQYLSKKSFDPKDYTTLFHELLHVLFNQKLLSGEFTESSLNTLLIHLIQYHPHFTGWLLSQSAYQHQSKNNSISIVTEWISYVGQRIYEEANSFETTKQPHIKGQWGDPITERDKDILRQYRFLPATEGRIRFTKVSSVIGLAALLSLTSLAGLAIAAKETASSNAGILISLITDPIIIGILIILVSLYLDRISEQWHFKIKPWIFGKFPKETQPTEPEMNQDNGSDEEIDPEEDSFKMLLFHSLLSKGIAPNEETIHELSDATLDALGQYAEDFNEFNDIEHKEFFHGLLFHSLLNKGIVLTDELFDVISEAVAKQYLKSNDKSDDKDEDSRALRGTGHRYLNPQVALGMADPKAHLMLWGWDFNGSKGRLYDPYDLETRERYAEYLKADPVISGILEKVNRIAMLNTLSWNGHYGTGGQGQEKRSIYLAADIMRTVDELIQLGDVELGSEQIRQEPVVQEILARAPPSLRVHGQPLTSWTAEELGRAILRYVISHEHRELAATLEGQRNPNQIKTLHNQIVKESQGIHRLIEHLSTDRSIVGKYHLETRVNASLKWIEKNEKDVFSYIKVYYPEPSKIIKDSVKFPHEMLLGLKDLLSNPIFLNSIDTIATQSNPQEGRVPSPARGVKGIWGYVLLIYSAIEEYVHYGLAKLLRVNVEKPKVSLEESFTEVHADPTSWKLFFVTVSAPMLWLALVVSGIGATMNLLGFPIGPSLSPTTNVLLSILSIPALHMLSLHIEWLINGLKTDNMDEDNSLYREGDLYRAGYILQEKVFIRLVDNLNHLMWFMINSMVMKLVKLHSQHKPVYGRDYGWAYSHEYSKGNTVPVAISLSPKWYWPLQLVSLILTPINAKRFFKQPQSANLYSPQSSKGSEPTPTRNTDMPPLVSFADNISPNEQNEIVFLLQNTGFVPWVHYEKRPQIKVDKLSNSQIADTFVMKFLDSSSGQDTHLPITLYHHNVYGHEKTYATNFITVAKILEEVNPGLGPIDVNMFIGHHPFESRELVTIRKGYIDGHTLFEELKNTPLDKHPDLLLNGLITYLHLYKDTGYFLDDPHPSNIIVTNDEKKMKINDLDQAYKYKPEQLFPTLLEYWQYVYIALYGLKLGNLVGLNELKFGELFLNVANEVFGEKEASELFKNTFEHIQKLQAEEQTKRPADVQKAREIYENYKDRGSGIIPLLQKFIVKHFGEKYPQIKNGKYYRQNVAPNWEERGNTLSTFVLTTIGYLAGLDPIASWVGADFLTRLVFYGLHWIPYKAPLKDRQAALKIASINFFLTSLPVLFFSYLVPIPILAFIAILTHLLAIFEHWRENLPSTEESLHETSKEDTLLKEREQQLPAPEATEIIITPVPVEESAPKLPLSPETEKLLTSLVENGYIKVFHEPIKGQPPTVLSGELMRIDMVREGLSTGKIEIIKIHGEQHPVKQRTSLKELLTIKEKKQSNDAPSRYGLVNFIPILGLLDVTNQAHREVISNIINALKNLGALDKDIVIDTSKDDWVNKLSGVPILLPLELHKEVFSIIFNVTENIFLLAGKNTEFEEAISKAVIEAKRHGAEIASEKIHVIRGPPESELPENVLAALKEAHTDKFILWTTDGHILIHEDTIRNWQKENLDLVTEFTKTIIHENHEYQRYQEAFEDLKPGESITKNQIDQWHEEAGQREMLVLPKVAEIKTVTEEQEDDIKAWYRALLEQLLLDGEARPVDFEPVLRFDVVKHNVEIGKRSPVDQLKVKYWDGFVANWINVLEKRNPSFLSVGQNGNKDILNNIYTSPLKFARALIRARKDPNFRQLVALDIMEKVQKAKDNTRLYESILSEIALLRASGSSLFSELDGKGGAQTRDYLERDIDFIIQLYFMSGLSENKSAKEIRKHLDTLFNMFNDQILRRAVMFDAVEQLFSREGNKNDGNLMVFDVSELLSDKDIDIKKEPRKLMADSLIYLAAKLQEAPESIAGSVTLISNYKNMDDRDILNNLGKMSGNYRGLDDAANILEDNLGRKVIFKTADMNKKLLNHDNKISLNTLRTLLANRYRVTVTTMEVYGLNTKETLDDKGLDISLKIIDLVTNATAEFQRKLKETRFVEIQA